MVAPPYDVIAPDEQRALEARSPYNAVRVELPRDDGGRNRYDVARDLLEAWQQQGILATDPAPAFYAHRMTFSDESGQRRHSVGVIGALGLSAPGTGDILPHEHTTPKAKSDRLQLLTATATNLSPIWGLSLAAGLSSLVESVSGPAAGAPQAVDADGVVHELWPITDPPSVEAISAMVGSAPVVIADGHHRFETALTYQGQRRESGGDGSGPFDFVMALVVELSDEQLAVRAIHRLLTGLPEGFDLLAALETSFEIVPTDPVDATIGERMISAGSLALVTPEGAWLMQAPSRAGRRRIPGPRFQPPRRRPGPAASPPAHLPARMGSGRRRRRQGRGTGGRPAAAGLGRQDRRHRSGRATNAPEDHLLLAEAPHRVGVPIRAGLTAAPPGVGRAG